MPMQTPETCSGRRIDLCEIRLEPSEIEELDQLSCAIMGGKEVLKMCSSTSCVIEEKTGVLIFKFNYLQDAFYALERNHRDHVTSIEIFFEHPALASSISIGWCDIPPSSAVKNNGGSFVGSIIDDDDSAVGEMKMIFSTGSEVLLLLKQYTKYRSYLNSFLMNRVD